MSAPDPVTAAYIAAAEEWMYYLPEDQRTWWLDAAEADGRERSPLAAFLLAGDIEDDHYQPSWLQNFQSRPL